MNIITLHPRSRENDHGQINPLPNLQMFTVRDKAMVPDYHPCDAILVDTNHTVPCDGDFVIQYPSCGPMVKALQVIFGTRDRVRVISVNTEYPTQEVALKDMVILGKVIGKWVLK